MVGELRRELSEQFHRKAGAKTILYGLQKYGQIERLPFVAYCHQPKKPSIRLDLRQLETVSYP